MKTLAKQTPAEKFKSIHAAMTPEEKGCWPMLAALGHSQEIYRPLAKRVYEGTLTMAQATDLLNGLPQG
jgi:hypothetical protein